MAIHGRITLILIPLLFAFTSIDVEIYNIRFSPNEVSSDELLQRIESHMLHNGFELTEKVEEVYPTEKAITFLSTGTPYYGGVRAKITLNKDTQKISLEAMRYRGGCSRTYEIKMMSGLITSFERTMKEEYDYSITVEKLSPPL